VQLVVVMMLGICVPSIATGFAQIDEAASKAASSPPAPMPAKATGELTDGERLFQGAWELKSDGSAMSTGTLRIDGRDFSAETIHGSYTGYVSIRSDTTPAQVDFTIENCECKFDEMTSMGIYYEDDGTIVFATPAPGEPRLEAFTGLDVTKVMLVRATRSFESGGEMPR
jgi:hypothetical protein